MATPRTSAYRPTIHKSRKGHFRRTRKLVALLLTRDYRHALRFGVAATVEHNKVHFTTPIKSVIDVGAHQGQFALLIKHRFPDARLYCVEPLEEARTKLQEAVGWRAGVTVFGVAAAEAKGLSQYHVSRKTDSSSLRPILGTYTTAFPGTEEASVISVETLRLDELLRDRPLPRPSLLKIDVQGAELDVLRGALGLLDRVDDVFVECSFVEFYREQALADEVIDFMHTHEFRLAEIYSVVYDRAGRTLQADFLFKRRR